MEKRILTIPTSWENVSLKVGQKLFAIDTTDSGLTQDIYFQKIVDAFEFDIENISLEERRILREEVFTLMGTEPKTEYNNEFFIHGNRYLLEKDLSLMNWDVFRDKNIFIERNNHNFWDALHLILAALIRPAKRVKKTLFSRPKFKIKKYDYAGLEERAELFQRVFTMSDVYGIALYFFFIVNSFIKLMTTFSSGHTKVNHTAMNEQKNLDISGVGKNGHST